ncbi:Zinc finger, CCHC-type [Sesbania bispinosa]|nr:Zinc finger, CCHC-type [Sesbania bispinosa]
MEKDKGTLTVIENWESMNEKVPCFIVFDEEDIKEGSKDCENSIIGKMLTQKSALVNSLSNALRSIWGDPKGFKIVDLDAEKALKGSPWTFRSLWLVLRRWDRSIRPHDMNFFNNSVWIQMRGLPIHCITKHMGKHIGACMGTVIETDIYEISGRGSFIRALVNIDASEPLLPGINTGSKTDGVFWVEFQYEKLPLFCYSCGLIGHDEDGCPVEHHVDSNECSVGPCIRANQSGRKVREVVFKNRTKPLTNSSHDARRKKEDQELLDKLSGFSVRAQESSSEGITKGTNANMGGVITKEQVLADLQPKLINQTIPNT